MTEPRSRLIADLAADLQPVRAAGRTGQLSLLWLVVAAIVAAGLLLASGPLRPGALAQLAHSPQFLLESLVGILAIASFAIAGFRLAIPSMRPVLAQLAIPLALLSVWVAFYLYGLHSPALEPSMIGKREACWLDTLVVGIPALIAALWAARRLWPLHGGWTGLALGLAAGAMPALIMQFACMYTAAHNLVFHLLPGLLLGPIGAIAGLLWLRRR